MPKKSWPPRYSPHQGGGQCITERRDGGGGDEQQLVDSGHGNIIAPVPTPSHHPVNSAIPRPLKVLPSPADSERRRMVLTIPRGQNPASFSQQQAALQLDGWIRNTRAVRSMAKRRRAAVRPQQIAQAFNLRARERRAARLKERGHNSAGFRDEPLVDCDLTWRSTVTSLGGHMSTCLRKGLVSCATKM